MRRPEPADQSWRWAALIGGASTLLALAPLRWAWAVPGLFVLTQVNAVAAVVTGVRRHRPAQRAPWIWIGAASALALTAGIASVEQAAAGVEKAYPTPADVLLAATFVPLLIALLLIARSRTPGHDAAALIDATLGTLAVAVVAVVFLLPDEPFRTLHPLRLAQPLLGVLVLGVLLRLLLPGGRRQPALLLGVAAIACLIAAHGLQLAAAVQGHAPPAAATIALLLTGVLTTASALHPSMASIAEPVPSSTAHLSWTRFAILAAAAVLVPALHATRAVHGRTLPAAALGWAATAIMGLVVLRLAVIFHEQHRTAALRAELDRRRAEARLGVLVQHSSDVVVLLDADGHVTYATPSVRLLLGVDPDDLVGRALSDLLLRSGTDMALLPRLSEIPPLTSVPVDGDHVVRHRDGSRRLVQVIATNLLEHPDVGALVLTARDVTAQRQLEQELRRHALTDSLTGLPNRALFTDRVNQALAARRRDPDTQVAVLFVDMDDFKTVNDGLGHDAGDQLLITIADRLQRSIRFQDTAARLGGDEFAVLLTELDGVSTAEEVADRILGAFADVVEIHGRSVRRSASIGITVTTPGTFPTTAEMLRDADTAMYAVKTAGKAGRGHFTTAMHTRALRRLDLISELDEGLREQQFTLQYQPIVDLAAKRIVGAEALVRWDHPRHGRIPPKEFIGLAEETGAIVPLGRWILEQACSQLGHWRAERTSRSLTVSINVSARQLASPDLVDDVARVLHANQLPGQAVTLELTESALIDAATAAATLQQLRDLGVRIAVDDFGTGYSSLAYLAQLPIDVIKLDRSFISRITDQPDEGLIRASLALAAELRMSAVAEGIETAQQADVLTNLHCPYGQGYLFDRPLDAGAFTARLADTSLPARAPR